MKKIEVLERTKKKIIISRLVSLENSDPNGFLGIEMKENVKKILGNFTDTIDKRGITIEEKLPLLEEERNKLFLLTGQMSAKLSILKEEKKIDDPCLYTETGNNLKRMDTIIEFLKEEVVVNVSSPTPSN